MTVGDIEKAGGHINLYEQLRGRKPKVQSQKEEDVAVDAKTNEAEWAHTGTQEMRVWLTDPQSFFHDRTTEQHMAATILSGMLSFHGRLD